MNLLDSLESSLKRHKCSPSEDGDADCISNLPESIISSILSLLPTKDAVATSLLSKGWRFHWTSVTSFEFDFEEQFTNHIQGETEKPCPFCPGLCTVPYNTNDHGDVAENTGFVDFVEMVLGRVSMLKFDKFHLHCRSPDLLSKWVNTAIDRNVRVLDLATTPRAGSMASLPDALYTSGTLEVLKLEGPIQLTLPKVVCLPRLIVLELNKVIYESDASFIQLISGCLVLQSLTIKRIAQVFRLGGPRTSGLSDNLVRCTISSPSLRRLQIYFEYEVFIEMQAPALEHAQSEYRRLGMSQKWRSTRTKLKIDAPVLEYVKIHDDMSSKISILGPNSVNEVDLNVLRDDWIYSYDIFPKRGLKEIDYQHEKFCKCNAVVDLVDTFNCVKFMKLGHRTMEALRKYYMPLYGCFARLTKLVIRDKGCDWSTLIELLGNCASLEVLDICDDKGGSLERYLTNKFSLGHEKDIDIDKDVPGCLLSSLKHVTVRRFAGYHKREMALLQLLLKYGSVMERLNLSFHKLVDSKRKSYVLNEVSKFSRKSPTCEISECAGSEEDL